MSVEKTTFDWGGGTVSGIWDHPESGRDYLILGHGAGGTLQTPQLKTYAERIAARGLGAVRFNFAYAEAGKKAPDRTDKLEACYRAVAETVSARADRLFIGGRSMGGRIGSHIVAQGFPVAGLVFLAYPLHPPGKPERLRDEHLKTITIPMLFLQGSRDPFAQPDLLDRTIAALPTATLHRIENGDHSHKVPGRPAVDVMNELVDATFDWLRGVEG
ncbi:MAG: alpha/beta hydrolase family protein [Actinomycetota bacterium]